MTAAGIGRVAVVGGGVGGLFAALALARLGLAVEVLERAPELTEIGAGLQLPPNATRLLAREGVLEAVATHADRPERAELRLGRSDWTILRLPFGRRMEARLGAPYLHVHRADLLGALADSAVAAGVRIRLGAEGLGVDARGVDLVDGGRIEADLVVAADGARSQLRPLVDTAASAPRYIGEAAWRATIPLAAPAPGGAIVWAGPGRHLVAYPLRRGRLLNLVAVAERGTPPPESWAQSGNPTEMRAAFSGWAEAPAAALAAVTSCGLWGLYDHAPLARWVSGRLALIGDAAHPMPPYAAQGAAQAIEDGAALAAHLAAMPDPDAALAAWQAARRPRAAQVQAAARANGRLFHLASPLARALRYGHVALGARIAPGVAERRLDWLHAHDAGRVARSDASRGAGLRRR